MNRLANVIKGSDSQNPFSDSQPRNFSDTKITSEFYPISNYWSLFNDQHEILLGTRGSGKTFLLKMMRYSMLRQIHNPQANQLVQEKKYLALYVPMYLEFVTRFTSLGESEENQIKHFQFAFNCLLAQSLLTELTALLDEESDKLMRAKTNLSLSVDLNDMWFNDNGDDISDLFSLSTKLTKTFYTVDSENSDISSIPIIFKRQIGSTLLAVKELVAKRLNLPEEPTWIICIDEAEFLTEPMLKCINSIFRSDSKRIALKVATLPYYHTTLETLMPTVAVSAGNDFSYRVVDMKYDSADFRNLTNSLCSHRLKTRFDPNADIDTLEDFVGNYGNDDLVDYYREELGDNESAYEYVIKEIISDFSTKRKKNAASYPNPRKTIYDKFAPIFFTRRMYELSRKGNTKPGWYAGSQMIRKISQGNPRAFIQIMNNLFEKARTTELTPKAQHRVLYEYAESFCESTQALEIYGPQIYVELAKIASILHDHVHKSVLISAGCNFVLNFQDDESFAHARNWIQLAIAYSRLIVDEDTLENGISKTTKYLLANTYAAKYWLPMRADVAAPKINIIGKQVYTYTVKTPRVPFDDFENNQLSLFEED